MFKLRKFQREDLACGALHPGFILGWAPGLGKTIAMFLWPLLKVGLKPKDQSLKSATLDVRPQPLDRLCPAQPVLLVVPGDGHDQTDDESREHFKTVATRLDSQSRFYQLSTLNPQLGTRELPSGYYLASYTQLATNGVSQPPPETPSPFLIGIGETRTYSTPHPIPLPGRGGEGDGSEHSTFNNPPIHPSTHPTIRIKCVYDATLMDLCQDCFSAVVVDEATKLQGEETLVSVGVRQIRAPHRLPMTATPIKNRLPQIFRLAHFACGGHDEPTARFPFGDRERDSFAAEFQVTETVVPSNNPTIQQSNNPRTSRKRRTAQACNLLRAWKIFAPIILRRRKEDCGEDIVPMLRHVVRAPMGIHQAATYKYHVQALYQDKHGRNNAGARLQALRIAAANPSSRLLVAKELPKHSTFNIQHSTFNNPTSFRSAYSYIPKVATTLKLIEGVLQRGEQALIGAAFEDALEALSDRLVEAGIPHLLLDGRTTPKKRGQLARLFKQGCPRSQKEGHTVTHSQFPIVLAGVESMAELHSFRWCNNVILTSYSWALDKMEQIIARAHRMNSPWPVNLWSVLCERSADRVLEASIHEKRDAAELVLDGQSKGLMDCWSDGLLPDGEGASASNHPAIQPSSLAVGEVNLSELLERVVQDFEHSTLNTQHSTFLDERDLEQDWPKLRASLSAAFKQWKPEVRGQRSDIGLPTSLPRLNQPPPMPLIGEPGVGQKVEARGRKSECDDLPLWKARLQRRSQ